MPRPKTLLDLPFELREMIYISMLPNDRLFNFPTTQQRSDETNVVAACASHETIYEELKPLISQKCEAHITMKPERRMDGLVGMEWEKFKRIVITIDHYKSASSWTWTHYWIRQVVSELRYSGMLPDLTIQFREDNQAAADDVTWTVDLPSHTSFHWTDPIDPWTGDLDYDNKDNYERWEDLKFLDEDEEDAYHDDNEDQPDTWLRSTGMHQSPITVQILEAIFLLPPCRSVVVRPLDALALRRSYVPRHDRYLKFFDDTYMRDLWAGLERWLRGELSGVNVTGDIDDIWGEPPLEQLAYSGGEASL